MEELIFAMQDHSYFLNHYLDTKTGDIIPLSEDSDCIEEEEDRDKIESDESNRFIYIEPIGSSESYRIMEDFIYQISNNEIKMKLSQAINRSKPFRRFKDQLSEYPDIEEKWFEYNDSRMKEYALEWLKNNGIKI